MQLSTYMPVRVLGGADALGSNSARLRSLGTRCLLVTGGSSAKKSGALADAEAALREQGITYNIFDRVEQNPLVSVCHAAGVAAREMGADFLLGIGGGSALDATKAAAIFAANPTLLQTDVFAMQHPNAALPFALIGTTAGTGSEVTRIAVLTRDADHRKQSLAADDLYARFAFADARYTHTMPYGVTLSTALDALSHVLEGLLKKEADALSWSYARQAIPMLWQGLCDLLEKKTLPDAAMREQLYAASLLAGLVINTCGTAFCHPMGYILSEDYGVLHGTACAVFLPALLSRAEEYAPYKYAEIASIFGEDMQSVQRKIAQMADVSHIRMDDATVAHYEAHWTNAVPKNFATSPGGLTPREAAGLLKSLFSTGS